MPTNMQVLLASRPTGWVEESNFNIVETPIPKPGPGELLVKNHWLSLDPYMRGRMNDAKSYTAAGQDRRGDGRRHGRRGGGIEPSQVQAGRFRRRSLGWQLYGVSDGEGLMKVDPKLVPLSAYLGVAGMPGGTAWIGLLEHCQPKAGETVVVSAAIGRRRQRGGAAREAAGLPCRGHRRGRRRSATTSVKELGFDACVDYKAGNLHEDLKAAAPDGIDCYFENVGGEIMDTVLPPAQSVLARGAVRADRRLQRHRALRHEDDPRAAGEPRQAAGLHRIRPSRSVCARGAAARQMGRARQDQVPRDGGQGLQSAPKAFIGMLKGANLGKQLVKLT